MLKTFFYIYIDVTRKRKKKGLNKKWLNRSLIPKPTGTHAHTGSLFHKMKLRLSNQSHVNPTNNSYNFGYSIHIWIWVIVKPIQFTNKLWLQRLLENLWDTVFVIKRNIIIFIYGSPLYLLPKLKVILKCFYRTVYLSLSIAVHYLEWLLDSY